ncbi:MAG: hypothetical protein KDC95_06120 [Planctomycetes bacterium]|nr:hypothetical protein [Planctomycetota bacterium]
MTPIQRRIEVPKRAGARQLCAHVTVALSGREENFSLEFRHDKLADTSFLVEDIALTSITRPSIDIVSNDNLDLQATASSSTWPLVVFFGNQKLDQGKGLRGFFGTWWLDPQAFVGTLTAGIGTANLFAPWPNDPDLPSLYFQALEIGPSIYPIGPVSIGIRAFVPR